MPRQTPCRKHPVPAAMHRAWPKAAAGFGGFGEMLPWSRTRSKGELHALGRAESLASGIVVPQSVRHRNLTFSKKFGLEARQCKCTWEHLEAPGVRWGLFAAHGTSVTEPIMNRKDLQPIPSTATGSWSHPSAGLAPRATPELAHPSPAIPRAGHGASLDPPPRQLLQPQLCLHFPAQEGA